MPKIKSKRRVKPVRVAVYYDHYHRLVYWPDMRGSSTISCYSFEDAERFVAKSGVEQVLKNDKRI